MKRGEVWWGQLPEPLGSRPVVLVSRQRAIEIRDHVTVAPITGTIFGLPVEVPLGPEDGLKKTCVANCDSLATIPKQFLRRRLTQLSDDECRALDRAIKFALGLD